MSERKLYKILLILIVLFFISSILKVILQTIVFEGQLTTINISGVYLILAWIELIWINRINKLWLKYLMIYFHVFSTIILLVFLNDFLFSILVVLFGGLFKLLIILFLFQSTIAMISLISSINNDNKNFNGYKNAAIIANAIICIINIVIVLVNDIYILKISFPIIQIISLSLIAVVITIGIVSYDKYLKTG